MDNMQSESFMVIDLNGTWLKVRGLEFHKSQLHDEDSFYDCTITFMCGVKERYDAQDVTILEEGMYEEEELAS